MDNFIIRDGVAVKYIGMRRKTVTVPDGVKAIGNKAFEGEWFLERVMLPESLEIIGEEAFRACHMLKKVVLPSGLRKIEDGAFAECERLESVEIPDSLEDIGDNVFDNCSRLRVFKIPENSKSFFVDRHGALYDIRKKILVKLPMNFEGEYVIPDDTREVCAGAFMNCRKLSSVKISPGVRSTGKLAFAGCSSLRKIDFSEGIEKIGERSFNNCRELEYAEIPSTVKELSYCAFGYCTGIREFRVHKENEFYCSDDCGVLYDKKKTTLISYPAKSKNEVFTVPESVREISDLAATYSDNLKKLVIPEGVKRIGEKAFLGCRKIETVVFPRGITFIGEGAFGLLKGVKDVVLPKGVEAFENTELEQIWKSFNDEDGYFKMKKTFLLQYAELCRKNEFLRRETEISRDYFISTAVRKEDIASLDAFFSYYENFTPEETDRYIREAEGKGLSVAYLLEWKKRNFPAVDFEKDLLEDLEKEIGLKKRTVEDWKKIYSFRKTAEGIEITQYKGTEESVVIPEKIGRSKVFSVGAHSFKGNYCIKRVVIPSGVTKIGEYAFCNCKNLISVTVPDSVTQIDENAFRISPNLTVECSEESFARKYVRENNLCCRV